MDIDIAVIPVAGLGTRGDAAPMVALVNEAGLDQHRLRLDLHCGRMSRFLA
jgi:uncharacterized protein (DUF2336 family)